MVTQAEALDFLAYHLAAAVRDSDNSRYATWGHAVNPHRNALRAIAQRLSGRDGDAFATAWVELWPRVVAMAHSKARAMANGET